MSRTSAAARLCFDRRFGFRASRLDLLETLPAAGDLGEDPVDTGGPDERLGIGIPSGEESIDRLLKILHTVE